MAQFLLREDEVALILIRELKNQERDPCLPSVAEIPTHTTGGIQATFEKQKVPGILTLTAPDFLSVPCVVSPKKLLNPIDKSEDPWSFHNYTLAPPGSPNKVLRSSSPGILEVHVLSEDEDSKARPRQIGPSSTMKISYPLKQNSTVSPGSITFENIFLQDNIFTSTDLQRSTGDKAAARFSTPEVILFFKLRVIVVKIKFPDNCFLSVVNLRPKSRVFALEGFQKFRSLKRMMNDSKYVFSSYRMELELGSSAFSRYTYRTSLVELSRALDLPKYCRRLMRDLINQVSSMFIERYLLNSETCGLKLVSRSHHSDCVKKFLPYMKIYIPGLTIDTLDLLVSKGIYLKKESYRKKKKRHPHGAICAWCQMPNTKKN